MNGTQADKQKCFELSKRDVEQLVVKELLRINPQALPMSVDFECRQSGGFCHCWWIESPRKAAQTQEGGQND